jgi:hypothetical protein
MFRRYYPFTLLLLSLCVLGFLAFTGAAQAAVAVTAQPVDISPLLQAFVAAAAAVITVLATLITAWLRKHLQLSQNGIMYQRVASGVNSLAQLALAELRSVESHNLTIDVKDAAVANALRYASSSFLVIAGSLGITDSTIKTWVTGALEGLLNSKTTLLVPTIKQVPIAQPAPAATFVAAAPSAISATSVAGSTCSVSAGSPSGSGTGGVG